ncbi:MAG: trypsin-like peptidase domain-containing protein [Candidatus Omnitrophica bacterium]|nr:trypsin-like peptidase domain-containing protein [Candidatus Omnitrophota bacterium]
MSANFNRSIRKICQSVYRFVAYHPSGRWSAGSGFFLNKKGDFLTCFHVAFGRELRHLRISPDFKQVSGVNEHSQLDAFYKTLGFIPKVELSSGSFYDAKLSDFDEKLDVALFKVDADASKFKVCKIDWRSRLDYGDRICFGGFPSHHDYQFDRSPLAVQEGIVSSFVETIIGGEKYQHVQLNSVNLGGNSGAPLFKMESDAIFGVINGNMNWGRDDVAIWGPTGTTKGSVRIPLSIAYATPMKSLRDFVFKNQTLESIQPADTLSPAEA